MKAFRCLQTIKKVVKMKEESRFIIHKNRQVYVQQRHATEAAQELLSARVLLD